MPVTLILKSSKRPSWLCSQTGTKMSPSSPPWNRSGGTSRPPPRWESGVSGSVAATAWPFHAWHSSLATTVPAEGGEGSQDHFPTCCHRDRTWDGRWLRAAPPAYLPHSLRRWCEQVTCGWDLRGTRSAVWGVFSLLQTVLFEASPTSDVVCQKLASLPRTRTFGSLPFSYKT